MKIMFHFQGRTKHVFVNSGHCLIKLKHVLNMYMVSGALLVSNDKIVTTTVKKISALGGAFGE